MKKLDGISSEAAKKATGYGWDEWLSILNKAGAKNWDHKKIVAYLRDNFGLSGWWQQTVTVAYEKAHGRRVIGQTADSGFQVGVQRTFPTGLEDVWALVTSKKGIACWLGKIARFAFKEGKQYSTESGIEGEIRVVKPLDRVRLTWQMPNMKRPATLQVALMASAKGKTALRVHLEHLPSQAFRQRMKEHWKEALDNLDQLMPSPKPTSARRKSTKKAAAK